MRTSQPVWSDRAERDSSLLEDDPDLCVERALDQ